MTSRTICSLVRIWGVSSVLEELDEPRPDHDPDPELQPLIKAMVVGY